MAKLPTHDEMAKAVMQHAEAHYERNGWDIVAETKTHEELIEMIKHMKCRTINGAINAVREWAKSIDERRREVQNEIF